MRSGRGCHAIATKARARASGRAHHAPLNSRHPKACVSFAMFRAASPSVLDIVPSQLSTRPQLWRQPPRFAAPVARLHAARTASKHALPNVCLRFTCLVAVRCAPWSPYARAPDGLPLRVRWEAARTQPPAFRVGTFIGTQITFMFSRLLCVVRRGCFVYVDVASQTCRRALRKGPSNRAVPCAVLQHQPPLSCDVCIKFSATEILLRLPLAWRAYVRWHPRAEVALAWLSTTSKDPTLHG